MLYAQVLSECMVLLGLFSYVIPNDKAGPEWTGAQFEELQLLVREVYKLLICLIACERLHDILLFNISDNNGGR